VRRSPEAAEAEILDAARELLAKGGLQELAVSSVMEHTSMQRSAFYHYFADRSALLGRLLELIEDEGIEEASSWLLGEEGGPALLAEALHSSVNAYLAHGDVLRAAHIASFQDEEIRRHYRHKMLQEFMDAVALRIHAENQAGRASVADPETVAQALVLMNSGITMELLGGKAERSQESVIETIQQIWVRAIYGG